MAKIRKDPDAKLDFTFDWTDWLAAVGDVIATATVTVPSGITKDSQSFDANTVTGWLSGGTPGESYEILCHITTTNVPAREDDRTMLVHVNQR